MFATHELRGPFNQFGIDAATRLQVVELDAFRRLTAQPLHDVGQVRHRRVIAQSGRELALVGGARNPIPLVKTPVRRKAPLDVAQVPFAEMCTCIASFSQQLRQRHLPACKALRQTRWHGLQAACADGVAARHQRRPGGHAVALDVEVLQQQAFARQLVDAGRWCASQCTTAITAKFPPTEVVGDDENNMGLVHLSGLVGFQP